MPTARQTEYKGRILFFHGFTQSTSIFYAKTSALRKKLKAMNYESIYLNGPFSLTPAQLPTTDDLSKFGSVQADSEEETNYRSWWMKESDNKFDLDPAVTTIRQYVEYDKIIDGSPEDKKVNQNRVTLETDAGSSNASDSKPPIVGLIGFSQGAALVGALVDSFEKRFDVQLKFAIMYSGFKLDTKLMPEYRCYYTADNGDSTMARLLHVVGELDTVVGEDRALSFYEISKNNSELLQHPGGHFVPNSKVMVEKVTNWIHSVERGPNEAEDLEQNKTKPEESVDDLLAMIEKLGG